MENQVNSPNNQNENPRPNPTMGSVDGFARPAQQTTSNVNNDGIGTPPSSSSPLTSSSSEDNSKSVTPSDDSSNHAKVTPMSTGGGEEKKSKLWTIILVILILLVFAAGIIGVYEYQQSKIKSLNSTNSSLTSENATLTGENNKLKSNQTTTINSQSSTNPTNTFKIAQINVELTVPASLADLTYAMNATNTTANLSTQTLTTLDPACTATATSAPLGSITKMNGNFPTTPPANTTLIKQYPTYYIAYIKPTGNCSKVAQVNTLQNSLVTDLNNTFKTIAITTN